MKATPYVAPKIDPSRVASADNVAPAAQPAAASMQGAVVYFAAGDAALDAQAITTVRSTAAAMMGIGTSMTITAYADRTRTKDANVEVAKQRAAAVRNALIGAGIASERIRLKPPVDVTGGGSDDKARRVDISMAQ